MFSMVNKTPLIDELVKRKIKTSFSAFNPRRSFARLGHPAIEPNVRPNEHGLRMTNFSKSPYGGGGFGGF